jgi:hypothetical protein
MNSKEKGKQTMKTKLLTAALLASAALIAQAQAGGHAGGGSGGGFGGGRSGGFSSFHGAPMGNFDRGGMMYSGPRFSAPGSAFHSYYGGAYAGRSIGSRQFSENITRSTRVASATGDRRIGNSSRAGSSSGQIQSGRNLPSNWQNHVVAQHSANWQRNWNRNRDHFWNGHHCRFINGSWFVFDFGFYPWWPYGYPYDYYGYGYYPGDYYPYDYDGGDYYGSSDQSAGSTVAAAQQQLARRGYYRGEIDGVIGPQTRRAIARYQSSHGLEVTGALTPDTLEALSERS